MSKYKTKVFTDFNKFIKISVRFIRPFHVIRKLIFALWTGPIFQHSLRINGDNTIKMWVILKILKQMDKHEIL